MAIKVDTDNKIQVKLAEVKEAYEGESDAAHFANVAEYFELAADLPRTLACLERAVELDDESARMHFLLARTLLKAGRWRDGGKELEVCSEIDSVELAGRQYHDNNLYYLGYALFLTDRYKEAAEAFRGAQNLIRIWVDPLVLKRFHFHQGLAWHLEGAYLEAAESYRRGLIAPGPGDSCDEDPMDEDEVEEAQAFNDEIEPYLEMAQQGLPLDVEELERIDVVPSFP